jgi:UDPglucose--hexose-1-phosphate uridylyltransferase
MELRKDPITRSWVITGDDVPGIPREDGLCRYCPDSPAAKPQVISTMPPVNGGPWSTQAVVHPSPMYRIEGEPQREGDGIYDKMRSVGAHEVLVENPRHDRHLWNASDEDIEQFLLLAANRIRDLKGDRRFKYVSVFKDFGTVAGQEIAHPTSQLVATTFIPRRILYELRAAKEYYANKERCVFCDIVAQDERQVLRVVEFRGDFVALCPYAPRVPFETWIISRTHDPAFERFALSKPGVVRELAALLRRTLTRIRALSDGFHLVLHTAPNKMQGSQILGYWKTLEDDYHWHIEILPILTSKVKSYTVKEVYYSPITSETAAARLREVSAE